MNDIEQKALALVNEVLAGKGLSNTPFTSLPTAVSNLVLLRAIEQHEAFRQEVSDALKKYFSMDWNTHNMVSDLHRFIIAKPDPLVEAWIEATGNTVGMEPLNAALEARGLEIREKNDGER